MLSRRTDMALVVDVSGTNKSVLIPSSNGIALTSSPALSLLSESHTFFFMLIACFYLLSIGKITKDELEETMYSFASVQEHKEDIDLTKNSVIKLALETIQTDEEFKSTYAHMLERITEEIFTLFARGAVARDNDDLVVETTSLRLGRSAEA